MTGALEINGKKMLSIKEAAKVVSYSRDHVTRLARENKIVATHIGRNWFVDIDSLRNYEEVSRTEQDIRKRRLSEERRRDLQVKEILKDHKVVASRKNIASRKLAVALSALVLFFGLGTGFWINAAFNSNFSAKTQVASIGSSQSEISTSTQTTPSSHSGTKAVFEADSTLRTFTEADSGILLLPQFSKNDTSRVQFVKNYFSDPVEIIVNEDGTTAVVMVDENGNPIGEPMPFVSVPINRTGQ